MMPDVAEALIRKGQMNQGVAKFGEMADSIRAEMPTLKDAPFVIVEGDGDGFVQVVMGHEPDNPVPGHHLVEIRPASVTLRRDELKTMVVGALTQAFAQGVGLTLEAVPEVDGLQQSFPDQAEVERFRPEHMGEFQVERGNLL
jgi:hypothetical protein